MKKFEFEVKNHMLPFLWVHGEEEAVYRKMIKAIDEANIKAFCVEARPHEGFLKDKWWEDMDIILDEAKKRNMGVYILDDKHFPTGYANGAVKDAPMNLRRQSIIYKTISLKKGEEVHEDLMSLCKWTPKLVGLGGMMIQYGFVKYEDIKDDKLYSVTAYYKDKFVSLEDKLDKTTLNFRADEDVEINVCFLTRNAGSHQDYINMLEKDSVRILINETYEKHYAHYKDLFGTTILGFFSDEPELGNYTYTSLETKMGTNPDCDYPFSDSFDKKLEKVIGKDYKNLLPLIWKNDYDNELTSKIRYEFMTTLTDQCSECFSKQIGEWCRERNVRYIGHMIEDNNLHDRTGSSLGHYFKGIKYQSWAGIDDIGGQVLPFMEESEAFNNPLMPRSGRFYHYTLGKLAVSSASISPLQKGNSMCEIFGNYGWSEGVYLEKYLLDHFMVRGVNNFVPHAFTCTNYPEPDCPPHFYAMGNNPQYRHFGKLMNYGNRITSLISDGRIDSRVAVLYHAEPSWCGKAMENQLIGEALYNNNVDYTFIPNEVFEQTDYYKTKVNKNIEINGNEFDLFVIGECDRIPLSTAEAVKELINNSGDVVFVNRLPAGTCEGEKLPEEISKCKVMSLDELASYAKKYQGYSFTLKADKVRSMHYLGKNDIYYLVNEGKETYQGKFVIDKECDVTIYDAFENKCYKADYTKENGKTSVDITLYHRHSLILVKGLYEAETKDESYDKVTELTDFKVRSCRAIDYPDFKDGIHDEFFSGFVSYEKDIDVKASKVILNITDAREGVEVFIDNKSLGIQIVPPFNYDITNYLNDGKASLRIEVATTLENERMHDVTQMEMFTGRNTEKKVPVTFGLTGKVNLLIK